MFQRNFRAFICLGENRFRGLLRGPLSTPQRPWQRQCLPATTQAAALFSLAPKRKAIIYFKVRYREPAGDQRLPFLKCKKRSVTSLSIVTKISRLESDTPPALKDRRQRDRQVITQKEPWGNCKLLENPLAGLYVSPCLCFS